MGRLTSVAVWRWGSKSVPVKRKSEPLGLSPSKTKIAPNSSKVMAFVKSSWVLRSNGWDSKLGKNRMHRVSREGLDGMRVKPASHLRSADLRFLLTLGHDRLRGLKMLRGYRSLVSEMSWLPGGEPLYPFFHPAFVSPQQVHHTRYLF